MHIGDGENPFGTTRRVLQQGGWARIVELPAFRLDVVSGPDRGSQWVLAQRSMHVGKDPKNEITLQDLTVSRCHVILVHTARGLLIKDLESTNGTWVNGARILEALLAPGDEFRVGETTIRVEASREILGAAIPDSDHLGPLVGGSPAMRELYALISAVAPSPLGVLVMGETGSGKELVARAIHELSKRRGACRVFDCGSTSADLIRSELFGHEQGAYTGAARERKGAFREADGGTLFIDEIGELPLELQPSLLRVLETGVLQPLGSDREYRVDVRVVAATNRDLPAEVGAGRFREDLYHRLSVVTLRLPPLRERKEDIPLLVARVMKEVGGSLRFTVAARKAMEAFDWPGNVRTLRNLIQRLCILRGGHEITPEDLDLDRIRPVSPGPARRPPERGGPGDPHPAPLGEVERETILRTLEKFGGHREKTAAALGISPSTLKRRLKSYREE